MLDLYEAEAAERRAQAVARANAESPKRAPVSEKENLPPLKPKIQASDEIGKTLKVLDRTNQSTPAYLGNGVL